MTIKKALKKYIINQLTSFKPLTIAKVYKEEKIIIEYPLENKVISTKEIIYDDIMEIPISKKSKILKKFFLLKEILKYF